MSLCIFNFHAAVTGELFKPRLPRKMLFKTLITLTAIVACDMLNRAESNYGDMARASQYFKDHHPNFDIKDALDKGIPEDVFMFFSIHDYNKDSMLDGHELRLAYLGYEFTEDKDSIQEVRIAKRSFLHLRWRFILTKLWQKMTRTMMVRYHGKSILNRSTITTVLATLPNKWSA
jgi:hypothetical protein